MAEHPKTYQPHWEENKKHQSSRKRRSSSSPQKEKFRRIQDKHALIGAIILVVLVVGYLLYSVGSWVVKEVKSMPFDNPDEEIQVDVLRIHKAEEQKALQMSDSLMQSYNLDSITKKVQIETVPVYRPPRKDNKWYITKKEWKDIWENIQIRRLEKEQEK